VTWGRSGFGGDSGVVRARLGGGVIAITANAGAFAALRADGTVVSWGNIRYGGSTSAVREQLTQVVQIVGSGGADQGYYDRGRFAALRADGSVVTWGSYRGGRVANDVASLIGGDVVQVFATATGLAALRRDGRLVHWGYFGGGVVAEGALAIANPEQPFELVTTAPRPRPPVVSLVSDSGTGTSADGRVQVQVNEGETWEWRQSAGDGWSRWQQGLGPSGVGTLFDPTAGQLDGPITVQVRGINRIGERSAIQTFVFRLDRTLPAAPDLALLRDTSGDEAVSSDPTLVVLGLEPQATWDYRWQVGDEPFGAWQAGAGDRIDLEREGLPDGRVSVEVRQRDMAGLLSPVGRFSFGLDRVAPPAAQLALLEPSPTSSSLSRVGVVTVAGIEDGARWQYRSNGSDWSWGLDDRFTLSGDGLQQVEVRQLDRSRNASPLASLDFTLDTTAPETPRLALVNASERVEGLSRDGRVQVEGLEANASWRWRINGGDWRPGRANPLTVNRDARFLLEV
jgi:hypothetical protein